MTGSNMRKIAVGDLGEFWYGDYKEPFEQLEGAVPGHPKGVVLKDDKGDLMCAFCGKVCQNLGTHAHHVHGLTAKEYRSEVGLLGTSSLVGEKLRVTMVGRARLRHAEKAPGWADTIDKAMAVAHTPAVRKKTNRRWGTTPERLNQTGRCYAQILAVARTVAQQEGGITARRLTARGVPTWAWMRYFDTIQELAAAVGARGNKPHKKWTERELRAALTSLAEKLGRTPSQSDLRRYGLSTKPFLTRWGTWTAACSAVGLDPNLPSPGRPSPYTEEDHVRFLVAYATTPNAEEVGARLGVAPQAVLRVLHRYGYPYGNIGRPTEAERQKRKAWAAEMARRVAGWPEDKAA